MQLTASTSGFYGDFGGQFVPEILVPPLRELENAIELHFNSSKFQANFHDLLKYYAGRPTPITRCKRLASLVQGPALFLKREDLLHTGAHKINHALGQCLLAQAMGKTRIIAETGAGQHGVATATACARLGLACDIFMGEVDMKRQAANVRKMQHLGARVIAVNEGCKTLKSAVNAALRDWSEHFQDTYYCLGSALGPHPYPQLVAQCQSLIGIEAREQMLDYGKLPTHLIACVGGGSNAIGLFQAFLNDNIAMIGVEAGGKSMMPGEHAARMQDSSLGVLHGCMSYVLQDDEGQIRPTHSISAGLDYPMIGPAHAHLHALGKAVYTSVTDEEALSAFQLTARLEGIIPALESSHAIAYYLKIASTLPKESVVLVNCSGRGDKDLGENT